MNARTHVATDPVPAAVPPAVPAPTPIHVVVLGGGFGGLAAVRELSRAASDRLRVTLVDRRNHHTFQPLLYQVATAGLQPQDIGLSFRAILRRQRGSVRVRLGEVVDIDPARRSLRFADGAELAYDRLVVAAGAITEDFGVPGVTEHAFGLKSLPDATALRNHVLRRFEAASAEPAAVGDGDLTFVIAGGGPTGVELAGALAELVDLVIRRDHPDLDLTRVRIVLVEPRDRLLGGFSDRSGRAALRGLRRRGVDVRLGTGIVRVDAREVVFSDGEVVPARTLVWAAGVAASPLATTLGVEVGPGRRLPVDDHLGVIGIEHVDAIGDVAGAVGRDGHLLPQVSPVAIQQGRYVARKLIAAADGSAPKAPFRYRELGAMATIGRNAAVADLPGRIHLGGFVGWVAWLLLHLLRLVGFKNRLSVLGSWVWNYLTYDHAARLILDQREAETVETAAGRVRRSWAGTPPPAA